MHLGHGFSLTASIVPVLSQCLVHFSQVPTGILRGKMMHWSTITGEQHDVLESFAPRTEPWLAETKYLQSVCQNVQFVRYVRCPILLSAPTCSAPVPVTRSPVGFTPPGPVVWLRLTTWCVHSRGELNGGGGKWIRDHSNLTMTDLHWWHINHQLTLHFKLHLMVYRYTKSPFFCYLDNSWVQTVIWPTEDNNSNGRPPNKSLLWTLLVLRASNNWQLSLAS